MIWAIGISLLFIRAKASFFFSKIFSLDSFSLRISFLLPRLIFLILCFSNPFLDKFFIVKGWFYFSSIILFLFGSFLSLDPFVFLILFEFCVFPMMYIFLILSKDIDKLESVLFIIFMNLFGSIPFMSFVSVWFKSENFYHAINVDSFLEFVVFIRFILLLVIKFPIFIWHVWLTKAHVRGSGFCSIILARVILKLGTFGFLKFIKFFQKVRNNFCLVLGFFCVAGCLVFLLGMLRAFDAKLLVARSSVVHMASIIPGITSMTSSGFISSIFMIVGHGFISFILFMLVSLIYERRHSRSIDSNKSLESVRKTFIIIFFFYLFLNLGLPPFISFIRELFFCLLFLQLSVSLFLLFCLTMVVSIIYVIFFTYRFIFGKKERSYCLFVDLQVLTWCFFIISWLIFLPLVFFSISLFKISLCGREEILEFSIYETLSDFIFDVYFIYFFLFVHVQVQKDRNFLFFRF